MQSTISPYTEAIIQKLARRLLHLGRAAGYEFDDIVQELKLHLHRRIDKYNKSRGTACAFEATVLNNYAATLAKRWNRDLEVRAGKQVPLEAALESVWYVTGTGRSVQETCEMQLDVQEAIATLSPKDQDLCHSLGVTTVTAAAQENGISRSTAYVRIDGYLPLFESRHLKEYL